MNVGRSNRMEPQEDDHTLLKKYVSILEGRAKSRGNIEFKCNFCHGEFKGSYFRIKADLPSIPDQGISVCTIKTQKVAELQTEVDEVDMRLERAMPKKVALLPSQISSNLVMVGQQNMGIVSASPFTIEGYEQRKRKTWPISQIEKSYNNEACQHLHKEIARLFFSVGLPFHIARNPYSISAFTYAANTHISSCPSQVQYVEDFITSSRESSHSKVT